MVVLKDRNQEKEREKKSKKKDQKKDRRRQDNSETVFKGLFRYQIKICKEYFYSLCCRSLTYFNANVNNFSKN